jgi:glycosyltransferase involved in cell wall biosynthesis
MRILLLAQKPQRRGAELFAQMLRESLRRQGHDARLAYLYPNGDAQSQVDGDFYLSGEEAHLLEQAPGIHPGLLRKLLALIDALKPDIVQANGARTVKYGALARRLRRHAHWRLVYRNIGAPQDWVRTPAHRLFYRRVVMPQVDGIIGVSRTTLAQALAFYGVCPPHVVIGGGVDPALLAPSPAREAVRQQADTPVDAPLLISVGSLSPEKRVDRLLRLTARLLPAHPELRCWIVGDGPLRGELESQAAALGILPHTHFWGAQVQVGDFLHAADLFVLTSDTEGLPAVVVEAGYLGLPVVATNVGGVAECVIHGQTGLLVPPGDEDALAAAVVLLLNQPAISQALGAAARRHTAHNYLVDQVAARYTAFYRQLSADGQG